MAITGETNVSGLERAVSVSVGGFLVLNAIRKRTVGSIAGAALGADLLYRGIGGHCQLYDALGIHAGRERKRGQGTEKSAPEVHAAITIGRSPDELYTFWRDQQNLPRIHGHFAEVTPIDDTKSHWRIHSPLEASFEWDSILTKQEAGREISWESLPGTQFPNQGSVQFRPAPGALGTEVRLWTKFEPPLGAAGRLAAKALRSVPRAITENTLRRFKSLVETGEIPTLANNPSGRGESDTF